MYWYTAAYLSEISINGQPLKYHLFFYSILNITFQLIFHWFNRSNNSLHVLEIQEDLDFTGCHPITFSPDYVTLSSLIQQVLKTGCN